MKRLMLASALAIGMPMAASLPLSAGAAQFNTVVPEQSEVTFRYQQMGVGMDGAFTRFNGDIDVDTDNPESGSASFAIDLSSVDTGTTDGDTEIVGSDWFNVDNHPEATFVSTHIQPTGENEYDVSGTLTLKGHEQTITIPVSFVPDGDSGVFEGEFTLKRGDFDIGEGTWSTFDIVANDVTVTVRITATQ